VAPVAKNGNGASEAVHNRAVLAALPDGALTYSLDGVLRTYNLHANCYITKPIDVDQFFKVLRSIESFWLSIVALPPSEAQS